jgi:hypothetical protein
MVDAPMAETQEEVNERILVHPIIRVSA